MCGHEAPARGLSVCKRRRVERSVLVAPALNGERALPLATCAQVLNVARLLGQQFAVEALRRLRMLCWTLYPLGLRRTISQWS